MSAVAGVVRSRQDFLFDSAARKDGADAIEAIVMAAGAAKADPPIQLCQRRIVGDAVRLRDLDGVLQLVAENR